MAIEAFLSVGSRRSYTTAHHHLNLWKTLLPAPRQTAVKVERQIAEVRRYCDSSRRNYSYSSNFSSRWPFTVFKRYYSSSRSVDDNNPSCFNVDKPVTSKVRNSTNGPGANQPMKKLPIGIQSIDKLLGEGYAYVDKTDYARRLITEGSPCNFMSRPRRFGKSLFLDTLREIFKGNRDLFKGYAIHESDYDWKQYPVVYLDFSRIISTTPEMVEIGLQEILQDIAALHGLETSGSNSNTQLSRLVTALSERAPVVVLVDEYDKPLIARLTDPDIADKNKEVLQGFFSTLKTLDPHLRFTFVTGISKFAQVSLFSSFNNLEDLTMDPAFADMMGYTEEELKTCFAPHIQAIAQEKSKESGKKVTQEDVLKEIREWYNGYRFSEKDVSVYNPFSTLNFLKKRQFEGYWYETGTPTFLIGELQKYPQSMISLDGTTATRDELMGISHLDRVGLPALMYQTGYFTIQDYNSISRLYQLGLPNEEVRRAFVNSLVKSFAPMTNLRASEEYVRALEQHHPDFLFKQIELGLSSFAYQVFVDAKERTYQGMLLSMLYGMGFHPLSERSTNVGRIDVVLEVSNTTYIMELKLDGSSDAALKQIHDKGYWKPYAHKGKQIVIMGANFSSRERNISDWKGELLSESGKKVKDIFPQVGE